MEIQQSFPNNYEIVHGEYFTHTNEPIITFIPIRDLIYVNAVCLKRLPEMEYAQFLVFSTDKRLGIRPCGGDEQNAVRLRSKGKSPDKPRYIRCQEFMRKMVALMQWNRSRRYRLLGNIISCNDEKFIMFDIASAEEFNVEYSNGNKKTVDVNYPAQWGDGFGVAFEDYLNNPLIKVFAQDTEIITGNDR